MTLAKNIRYLRKQKGWSQDELAEKLGKKSFTTIQKWESGVSDPPFKTLKVLAEIFEVDMDDLAKKDLETGKPVSIYKHIEDDTISIPVYGRVAAGEPIDANQDDIIGQEKISRNLARRGDFYALEIKGDSMEPMLFEGDTVIVREQPDAENGEIVVATVNGDDATCKKLYKIAGGIQLASLNSRYEPFTFSENDVESIPVRILGKVVEMRRRFA